MVNWSIRRSSSKPSRSATSINTSLLMYEKQRMLLVYFFSIVYARQDLKNKRVAIHQKQR